MTQPQHRPHNQDVQGASTAYYANASSYAQHQRISCPTLMQKQIKSQHTKTRRHHEGALGASADFLQIDAVHRLSLFRNAHFVGPLLCVEAPRRAAAS